MAGEPSGCFEQSKIIPRRPQGRKFLVTKSRFDTHTGIMPGDIIAANHPKKPGRDQSRNPPAGVAGHKSVACAGEGGKEITKLSIRKMVQNEVGDDQIVRAGSLSGQPMTQISGNNGRCPSEPVEVLNCLWADDVLLIEQSDLYIRPLTAKLPRKLQKKGSIAAA